MAQQRVTGSVGLKLWKGTLSVTKRLSPYSLYRADLASFTMGRYNPKDAEGFINLVRVTGNRATESQSRKLQSLRVFHGPEKIGCHPQRRVVYVSEDLSRRTESYRNGEQI